MQDFMNLFGLILRVAGSLEEARKLWAETQRRLDEMQIENRDPSKEEWSALFDLVQSQSNELQA